MTEADKLEVLQDVANEVVDRGAELKIVTSSLGLGGAMQSLEIILVAIGARHEPVFVEAMNPEKANNG